MPTPSESKCHHVYDDLTAIAVSAAPDLVLVKAYVNDDGTSDVYGHRVLAWAYRESKLFSGSLLAGDDNTCPCCGYEQDKNGTWVPMIWMWDLGMCDGFDCAENAEVVGIYSAREASKVITEPEIIEDDVKRVIESLIEREANRKRRESKAKGATAVAVNG